jgi:hypothetical protein
MSERPVTGSAVAGRKLRRVYHRVVPAKAMNTFPDVVA